jgi:hypothetical protein
VAILEPAKVGSGQLLEEDIGMSVNLIRYSVDARRLAFERKPAYVHRIAWISFAAAVIVFLATVLHAGGIVDPGIWRGRDIKKGKRDWQVGAPAETPPQYGSTSSETSSYGGKFRLKSPR